MGLLSWIVVGLIAGSIASAITKVRGGGCLWRIAVGVIGALIGGALAQAAGYESIDEFGLRAILIAATGSTLLLLVIGSLGQKRGAGRGWLDRR